MPPNYPRPAPPSVTSLTVSPPAAPVAVPNLESLPLVVQRAENPEGCCAWSAYLMLRLHFQRWPTGAGVSELSEEDVRPPDAGEALPPAVPWLSGHSESLREGGWPSRLQLEMVEHALASWYRRQITQNTPKVERLQILVTSLGCSPSEAGRLIQAAAHRVVAITEGSRQETVAETLAGLEDIAQSPTASSSSKLQALRLKAQMAGLLAQDSDKQSDLGARLVQQLEDLAESDDRERSAIILDVPSTPSPRPGTFGRPSPEQERLEDLL